jgi:hypothetical protein
MTKVNVSKTIQVPAAKAWSTLSSFRNIEAISPIERSETVGEGVGAKRTCYLPDGAAIYEVLNKMESDTMEMQYKITEGPFPVTGYVSDIKVKALGDSSCNITWECEFSSEDEAKDAMTELFSGFYNVIIDSLETMIQSQN